MITLLLSEIVKFSDMNTDNKADRTSNADARNNGSFRIVTVRGALPRRAIDERSQAKRPKPTAMLAPAIEKGINNASAMIAASNNRRAIVPIFTVLDLRSKRST